MGSPTQSMGSCRSLISIVLFVSLLLLILLLPSLFAQVSYEELERGLNLTDEQKTKIEEIKKRYVREWDFLREEALRREIELRRILNSPDPERGRIARLTAELQEIDRRKAYLFIAYRRDIRRILTEEQMRKYDDFCNERQKRMGEYPFLKRRYGR